MVLAERYLSTWRPCLSIYQTSLFLQDGRSPLDYALGDSEIMQMLLDKGADVNSISKTGETALYRASTEGLAVTVQMLLECGAKLDVKHKLLQGETALHSAAFQSNVAIVQLLLAAGANVHLKSQDGDTPLHSAVKATHIYTDVQGQFAVVQLLLAKGAGASVDVKNNTGETPLHLAASHGHGAVVELLLATGADITKKNKKGYTPMCCAAVRGLDNIVQLLLDTGAGVNVKATLNPKP